MVGGCIGDKGFTALVEYRDYSCPAVECDKVYSLSSVQLSDLQTCYGWDGEEWGAGAPAELDACTPLSDPCLIVVLQDEAGAQVEACGACFDDFAYDQGDPPPDVCCEDPAMTSLTWTEAGQALVAQLGADCGVWPTELPPICDPLDYRLWGDLCPSFGGGANACGGTSAPGADYQLEIDPVYSSLKLATSTDLEEVAVCGGGGAATGPARFMTALMWADDGELDGVDYTEWRFFFDNPIQFDINSGVFRVEKEENPDIAGTGYYDLSSYGVTLPMGSDATGEMDTSTWEWYLDYTETSGSDSMSLHLEGTFWAVD